MKVFINPGHDKIYDSGATNKVLGIREADIAYVIGALVEKYLNNVGIETKSLQSDNLSMMKLMELKLKYLVLIQMLIN